MRARFIAVVIAAAALTAGGIVAGAASASQPSVVPTAVPPQTTSSPPANATCPSDPSIPYYDDGCLDWDELSGGPADDLQEADTPSAEQAQADDAGQPVTVTHAPLRYPACGPKPTPGICIITDPARLKADRQGFSGWPSNINPDGTSR